MEQIIETLTNWGTMYGTRVLGAILILIVGRIVAGWLARIVKRLLTGAKVEETLTRFLATLTRIGLLTFVVLAALSTVGIQTASLIAVIGAAGLAIGFALQGSLSNLASGVMLVVIRPFKRGELVEMAGHLGVVKEIHIFNSIMTTLDNKRVIIPNAKITSDSIVNYSAEGVLRVDMVFGISYGDNIGKAKTILEGILAEDPRVLKDPAPMVAVKELGNSSVDFAVRPYVKVEDYWGVYFDVTEKVKLNFDRDGVSIPFPQHDVHMFQASA